MVPIVQNGDPVLREVAKEVPEEEIKGPKIVAILGRMKKALDSQEDGVAIAAPQIGVSLRIFVVSERTFDLPEDVGERRKQVKVRSKKYGHLVFINPVITKISKDKALLEEGCLSVRYKYGKIERSVKATVTAFDEHGKKFTRGGSGLLAQIFQHETDHLDGVLFVDKAIDVKDLPPAKKTQDS
ncbi:MAG: peptide deformylase [bacterium]|nr:peptide deformylase [bacterium]